jgi:hypothetical protein
MSFIARPLVVFSPASPAGGGLGGLAPGDPGLEALRRAMERASRTDAPLSVAFVAILAEYEGDTGRRASAVTAALTKHVHLVIFSADGEAVVCALGGVRASVARERMEAVRIDLARSGVIIEAGVAELVPGDTPSELVDRAGTAI